MRLYGGYLADLREAVAAAAASLQHLVVVGAPGWGKSAYLRSAARRLFGRVLLLSLDPAVPPSRVRGRPHPGRLLEGEEVVRVEGTLLDPSLEAAVLDEVFRASDPVFDALLPVLEGRRPLVLATANWVAKGDRVEALKDRFALWLHLQPAADGGLMEGVARTALEGSLLPSSQEEALRAAFEDPGLPPREELVRVWRSRPGRRAVEATAAAVREVGEAALRAGFAPNPRRIEAWARVVYGMGALLKGEDFEEAPPEALKALRFAWPTADPEEARAFARTVLEIASPGEAWTEARLAELLELFREIREGNPEERNRTISRAARLVNRLEEEGRRIRGVDPNRLRRLVERATRALMEAAAGGDPLRLLPADLRSLEEEP